MKNRATIKIFIFVGIAALIIFTSAMPSMAYGIPNRQLNTQPPVNIEALQQLIHDQGYSYTVAESWVTQLSQEERDKLSGYRPIKQPVAPLPENVGFNSMDNLYGSEEGMESSAKLSSSNLHSSNLPSSYDAMALGYVTSVKSQGSCGSCWIFGATANFESIVAKREGYLPDFSEQEVGDCNIRGQFCDGGIAYWTSNFFTKKGASDELCSPYAATCQTCYNCAPLKNVDNWRIITESDGENQIDAIKNAILEYGPVFSAMYAYDPGFGSYSSGVYEYWGTEEVNHAILIFGWDDSKIHSKGTGAWLIKNSWGNNWAPSGPYPGCAWVAYGSANLGDETSTITGYNNASSQIYYYDEYGCMKLGYGNGSDTAWGAVRLIATRDSQLESVDFWAVDVDMSYEIRVFDNISNGPSYTFSNQLGTTQTGYTNEMGYYSIPLNTPISLTSGDDFIVQVKFIATTSDTPIPIDFPQPISVLLGEENSDNFIDSYERHGSEESYVSENGTDFSKLVIDNNYTDIGIRARTSGLELGDAPDPTYPSLLASDGARHNPTDTECLGLRSDGDWKKSEPDARISDSDQFDDGLNNIFIISNNSSQTVTFEVTDLLAPSSNLTVNILIDLNKDGDWEDEGEHAVRNQKIITTTSQEEVIISDPFSTIGTTPGPTWLRITLTRHNISNAPWNGTMTGYAPTIPFEYGETEDWKVYLIEEGAFVHNLNTGENFSTINAAINDIDTMDGHTISVDPGTYYENVIVDKQLSIRSGSGNPIDTIVNALDADNHAFNVTVGHVNISGLTVTRDQPTYKAGIYLGSGVDHCNISNNNISDSYNGIYLDSSNNNNMLSNNIVKSNRLNGISLESSSSNTLRDNIAYDNLEHGISLRYSNHNTLTDNDASDNAISGIFLEYSDDNIINKNLANLNYGNGIYLLGACNNTLMNNSACLNLIGIEVFLSSNTNMLINNNVSGNYWVGIELRVSNNNTLMNNSANLNYYEGISVILSNNNILTDNSVNSNYKGILLDLYSDSNILTDNSVNSNDYGISLEYDSNNNILTNNSVNSNYYGISLTYDSNNNTLTDNIANSNNDCGIYLYKSKDNALTDNNVTSNNYSGIYLDESKDNTLTGNSANSNNNSGIYLDGSNNNALTNNNVTSNSHSGIYLDGSNDNNLTGNTVTSNNNWGIYLNGSKENLIYNNYFDNTNNACDDNNGNDKKGKNNNNIWNVTKTTGPNIIDGSYLGGNYWSDYAGVDSNGDGLGDTLTPYNSSGNIKYGGDYLPLVIEASVPTDTPPPDNEGSNGHIRRSGISGEAVENIVVKDAFNKYIAKDTTITFQFKNDANSIEFIEFYSKTNAGYIIATVEILKGRSVLVSTTPPGQVYQYMNIFVGGDYATDKNIANAVIGIRVAKSWIAENDIDGSTIILHRHSNGKWKQLVTKWVHEDAEYLYLEAETQGFSPFAITGNTISGPGGEGIIGEPTLTADKTPTPTDDEGIPGFSLFAGLSILLITVQLLRKRS